MNVTDSSIDTNILFYAFDARDPIKQQIANRVLNHMYRAKARIALQVLSEFYRAATRKLMSTEVAEAIVRDLRGRLQVIAADEQGLMLAIRLHQRHNLQFFDAVLLGTLIQSGVKILLSEDMQHESSIEGLLILNPFYLTSAELDLLLA